MPRTYDPNLMVPYASDGLTPLPGVKTKYGTENDRLSVESGDHVWKPNVAFDATLRFEMFLRGPSTMNALFKNPDTGKSVSMFMGDFETALQYGRLHGTELAGRFAFVKRGTAFGLKLVDIQG